MLGLDRKDKVLEIGCHQGTWSINLAGKTSFLVGLDVSLRDLSYAQKNVFSLGYRNTTFVLASAEFLPFKGDSFTKVLGVDVIEHISDDRKAVSEAGRVFKPKGRLVLTTLKKERRHYLKRIVFKDHLREYSWQSIEALFTSSSLVIREREGFYKFFSTIAREIHGLLSKYRGLPHLFAPLLVLLSKLDYLLPNGGGRGIAIMAEK
jgi:ubiquinone/menaquinone biosynthesis C-methylase UbiE